MPLPAQVAKVDEEDDSQSDVPILHRKHHADDSAGCGQARAPVRVPVRFERTRSRSRPSHAAQRRRCISEFELRRGFGSQARARQFERRFRHTFPDPDRPVLHRSDDTSSVRQRVRHDDSGRPKLKKKKKDDDEGYVEDVATSTDPNRPHLFHGKFAGYGAPVVPTLLGLPPDMQQTVAVSDATDRPVHPWDYIWANPDDEDKMKAAMEDLARTALGLNPPPAPKPTPKTAAAHAPRQAGRYSASRLLRFSSSNSASSSWLTVQAPPWCSPRTPMVPAPTRNSSP